MILSRKDKSINVKVSYQYLFLKTLSGVLKKFFFKYFKQVIHCNRPF